MPIPQAQAVVPPLRMEGNRHRERHRERGNRDRANRGTRATRDRDGKRETKRDRGK